MKRISWHGVLVIILTLMAASLMHAEELSIPTASIAPANVIIGVVERDMIKMTLTDLIQGSDVIVIGRVTDILPAKGGVANHSVYTDVVIKPERYLYGSGAEILAVRILGGTIGASTLWVEDQPEFTPNEEVLLFLRHITLTPPAVVDQEDYYQVVGLAQGKWEYKDDTATDIFGEKVSLSALEAIIPAPVAASIPLAISISGLSGGEEAFLRIGVEAGKLEVDNPLFEYPVQGTGEKLVGDIEPTLKDGYYLLMLDAPQKYFRDPKGYAFSVRNGAVVNPTGREITFNLGPLPLYLAMETVISLSAPVKEGIPPPQTLLWQQLLEPVAIIGGIIIAGFLAFVFWRRMKR